MRRLLPVFLLLGFVAPVLAEGIAVSLSPVSAVDLGSWASGKAVFRLYPSLEHPLKREGPEPAMALFGILDLGGKRYPLMFAVLSDNTPYLAIDLNNDWTLSADEGQRGVPLSPQEWFWHLRMIVHDRPYELSIVWPTGRGFLFLVGQTAMEGKFKLEGIERPIVLIDANVNGNYNDDVDQYVVDVDGDGVLHGEEGGHEIFTLTEAFTVGKSSYALKDVAADGSSLTIVPTAYVPPKVPLYVGAKAPNFSFRSLRGKEISLEDYRGKVVVLDFWASWCLPCVVATPKMKALYERYHDEGLEIIGISLDISRDQAQAFIEAQGLPWPQYWDGKGYDGKIAHLFRVEAIPTIFLIDQDGVIRGRWLGLAEEELNDKVRELLAGSAADTDTGKGGGPTGTVDSASSPAAVGERGNANPGEGEAQAPSPAPILAVEGPGELELYPSGSAEVTISLSNTSEYEAEDVRVAVTGLPAGISADPWSVDSLKPGAEADARIPLHTGEIRPGTYPAKAVVTYTYCVSDEACFKLSQEIELRLTVPAPAAAGDQSAQEANVRESAPPNILWFALAVGAAVALLFFLLR